MFQELRHRIFAFVLFQCMRNSSSDADLREGSNKETSVRYPKLVSISSSDYSVRTARFFSNNAPPKLGARSDRASQSGPGKRTFRCDMSRFSQWTLEKSPKNCWFTIRTSLCFELEQIRGHFYYTNF